MVLDLKWLFHKKTLCTILFCALSGIAMAESEPTCDEFPLSMKVEHIGKTELTALICGDKLFLSVTELFGFLRIKASDDPQQNALVGYIRGMDDTYRIDVLDSTIVYQGNIFGLSETDIKKQRSTIFLGQEILYKVFGLKSTFNYRNLSVLLQAEAPLPYVKKLFRDKLRNNLNKYPGHPVADTTLIRYNSELEIGTATWDIFTSQRSDGSNYNRVGLGLGGGFMGGDFSAKLNLVSNEPFNSQNQFYRWQLINNQSKNIRQLVLGKINIRPKASIFSPIVGVHITNRPTYQKQEFGRYTISDFTKANWMVELYINNVLVDFTKADDTGFYQFEIPLGYGITTMDIRCFGPFGEEEHLSKQLSVPLGFQPKGNVEYDLSAGMVEETGAFFFQSGFNYGISQKITVGGGLEYLSTLQRNSVLPFITGDMRLGPQTLLSGTYLHNVGYRSNLLYQHPKNHRLDLSYTKYEADQNTVLYTYKEKRSAVLTNRIGPQNVNITSRLALHQTIFKHNTFENMDWLLNAGFLGFNANLNTRLFFSEWAPLDYVSQFRLSKAVFGKLFITSQLEYSFKDHDFNSLKAEISKSIFKDTQLRASIEQNFKYDRFYLNFGINIGLGFSRLGLSGSMGNNQRAFSQHLRGSLNHTAGENELFFDDMGSLGRASVLFEPFLDGNGNGIKDKGETTIKGLEVYSANGGKKKYLESGSITFMGMEPYVDQYFSFDLDALQNIAWTLDHESMSLILSPNQVKGIKIPIKVVGEVLGVVQNDGQAIGGLKMELKTSSGKKVAELVSENDGYFGHYGLPNGEYLIQFDSIQLAEIGLRSEHTPRFTIDNGTNGDYVDDLHVHLKKINGNSAKNIAVVSLENQKPHPDNKQAQAENVSVSSTADKGKTMRNGTYFNTDDLALVQQTDQPLDSLQVDEVYERLFRTMGTAIDLPGLTYGIHLFTTSNELPSSHPILQEYPDMIPYERKGGYGYLFGGVNRFDEASKLARMARENGIRKPTVVPLYNGRPLSPDEFGMLLKLHGQIMLSSHGADKDSLNPLAFKVQLKKSKEPLQVNAGQFDLLPDLFEYYDGHHYKYFLKKSLGLKNAIDLKETLAKNGFGNATVVPFDTTGILSPLQVYGQVRYREGDQFNGMAGTSISIYNELEQKVVEYLTDADGTFMVKGLPPGNYKAMLDISQLETFTVMNEEFSFSIPSGAKGSLIEKNWVLGPPSPRTKKTETPKNGRMDDLVFKVQILAVNESVSVNHGLFSGLANVQSYTHLGMYKYTVGEFKLLEDARALKLELQEKGFKDAFIVCFYKNRRLKMLELTGRIFIRSEDQKVGMEGIKLHVYPRDTNKMITTLVSEHEGYFHFLGLKPGKYRIEGNALQLQRLGLKPANFSKDFEIRWDLSSPPRLLSIDLLYKP